MNKLIQWLPGLIIFATLLLAQGQGAFAQGNTLTSRAEPTYAQNVAFTLSGEVDVFIERVDLFLQPPQAERPFAVQAVRVRQNNGQLLVEVDLDPREAALLPFAQVQYWWELRTATGDSFSIPPATFIYEDDRFVWRELSEGDVTIHWTGNDVELGQIARAIVAESRQFLDKILPQTAVSPLHVYIYPSTGDLRSGLRLAGRDRQAGHTDPDLGVLLVTAVNPLTAASDLGQSIPHELTHLRLYQLAAGEKLPVWYEEGLALLAEDSALGADTLATAVLEKTTVPLLNLCVAYPQGEAEEILAQAQSASLLSYIRSEFGDQALRQLGTAYLAGASCETGLTQTLGMSLSQLNIDWLATQAAQPGWRIFLGQNGLWLLLVLSSFGMLALLLKT